MSHKKGADFNLQERDEHEEIQARSTVFISTHPGISFIGFENCGPVVYRSFGQILGLT